MKGAFAVDKLKSVDQVTVVSSNGSIYFSRIDGLWNNHIKGEKLNDDDMGKLIAAYEEFGWNTIWPEPNAGFSSDKHNPEQIDVGMDEEQVGEMIVPDDAHMIVINTKMGSCWAFNYDSVASLKAGKRVYRSPFASLTTIDAIREECVRRLYDGSYIKVHSLDKDKNIIGTGVTLA